MEKRSHNGEGFLYRVSWREAGGQASDWSTADVLSPPFFVNNTGTYTAFEIKVQAVNSLGKGPDPEAEIGHSGEDSTSSQDDLVSVAKTRCQVNQVNLSIIFSINESVVLSVKSWNQVIRC